MRIFSSTKRYIFTPEVINYLVSFTLLTFIYNFSFFPVQVAHAAETEGNRAPSGAVIKAPASDLNRLEQLSKAPAIEGEDVHLPALIRDFKIVTEPSPVTKAAPVNKNSAVVAGTSRVVTMTAYNALPEQTDGDPCTTADGSKICDPNTEYSVVAANFLPFGTQVMIPDYFGDRVFTVHDRTARKYGDRMDVLMPTKKEALQFGKRQLRIVVVN